MTTCAPAFSHHESSQSVKSILLQTDLYHTGGYVPHGCLQLIAQHHRKHGAKCCYAYERDTRLLSALPEAQQTLYKLQAVSKQTLLAHGIIMRGCLASPD